ATALWPSRTEGATFALDPPRALDGVTLVAGLDGARLPRSFDVEVSADGVQFTTMAQRRRRGEREDLRWVNGHPQFVIDNDVLSVPLGGLPVAAVRLRPVASDEPWSLGELLLHPAQAPAARRPWTEWMDGRLSWPQRRADLRQRPLRDRADWYARVLLAARAP
ncbi:MAG TPA: hypothetical protein VFO85_16635, partial [Vicinamibacteria bacterium]|nr:hypothetical protein [Vicinamibacteria bacterium]